jgi:cyclic beta-1,2-glucan synthetase
MYRVAVECILGIQLRGDRLTLQPCIPSAWSDFEVALRRGDSTWRIRVLNPAGIETGRLAIEVDGEPHLESSVNLVDDGQEHVVVATLQQPGGVHMFGETGAAKVADKRPGR